MLFILLFSVGALAVPLAWDISKHGKDNIIRRSGQDILSYTQILAIFKSVNVATDKVSTAVLGAGSLAILIVAAYLVLRILGAIVSLFLG